MNVIIQTKEEKIEKLEKELKIYEKNIKKEEEWLEDHKLHLSLFKKEFENIKLMSEEDYYNTYNIDLNFE